MALIGACPGIVLVQASLGSLSGLKFGLGGLLGGMAFVKLRPLIYHTSIAAAENNNASVCGAETASDKPLL